MLNVLELLHASVNILEIFQRLLEKPGAIAQVAGHFSEHIEELCVSRDEANHVSGSSPGTLLLFG
jgi:hypothetical protein